MRRTMIILALLVTMALSPATGAGDGASQAIEYLIGQVAGSELVFVRNGKEHDSQQAADHMRGKYAHFSRKIQTAEDFITYAGTRSLLSGKPYLVILDDGSSMHTAEWLSIELAEYRLQQAEAAMGAIDQ